MTNITQMFNNYCGDAYMQPNNTCVYNWCEQPGLHAIIIGSEDEHYFITPFNYSDIKDLSITYKQGYKKVVITKTLDNISYYDGNVFYYKLSKKETEKFYFIPNEKCQVQVKVVLNNGNILFSDIYELDILNTLDASTADMSVANLYYGVLDDIPETLSLIGLKSIDNINISNLLGNGKSLNINSGYTNGNTYISQHVIFACGSNLNISKIMVNDIFTLTPVEDYTIVKNKYYNFYYINEKTYDPKGAGVKYTLKFEEVKNAH